MIKAFIFDMDGTIVVSEHLHCQAFNILLRNYGIFITKKEWQQRLVGTSSRFIAKYYIDKYHLPENLDDFVNRRRKKYQELVQKKGLKLVNGFKFFLMMIQKYGFKVAIASSGQRSNVIGSMRAVGIRHMPFICIEDVHFRKPNPEIYNKAAKMLHVKSEECIVFEDSVPGVEAAKRAGMPVVALLTTSPASKLKKLKPNLLIRDYRDLIVVEHSS